MIHLVPGRVTSINGRTMKDSSSLTPAGRDSVEATPSDGPLAAVAGQLGAPGSAGAGDASDDGEPRDG